MVRMNLEFVDRKITSELFKIWPKNDQVGQHMVGWWENLLQMLRTHSSFQQVFPPHAGLLAHCTARFCTVQMVLNKFGSYAKN